MKWIQTWPRAHPLRLGPLVIWLLSSTQVMSLRMPGMAKHSLDTHYPSRHCLSSAENSCPFHLHLANSYSSFRDTIFCEAFLSYPGWMQTPPSVPPQYPWVPLTTYSAWSSVVLCVGVGRAWSPDTAMFQVFPVIVLRCGTERKRRLPCCHSEQGGCYVKIDTDPSPRYWAYRSQVPLWRWEHVAPTCSFPRSP